MISVYVHRNGRTEAAGAVDPQWLDRSSSVTFWIDLAQPSADELRLLSDVFHFHPLSVEDAQSALQYPKIEPYPDYLYAVLHGIDVKAGRQRLATRDVDFFLGRNYLVSVHDWESRSITSLREFCQRHDRILAEGPVGLFHRIVDAMVDNYRPAIDAIEQRIEQLEEQAFAPREQLARQVIRMRSELAITRRILLPQRDVIGRLARREFPMISDEMTYRFRDVYDHVVRLTEEVMLFQDRITGILEVHLATVSNRLNQVMKVLTVISTIFLPLSVLTGMWGMNIPLPHWPGGEAIQFWWIVVIMLVVSLSMLGLFRAKHWI